MDNYGGRPYKCEKYDHLFCWLCLKEWLKNSSTCALCREDKDVVAVPDQEAGDYEDD